MGFGTGFFGGFSLTTSIFYLSLQYHRAHRLQQQAIIREQTEILNSLASPAGAYYRRFALAPPSPSHDIAGKRIRNRQIKPQGDEAVLDGDQQRRQGPRPGTEELLKHEWNKEIEKVARKVSTVRWEDLTGTAVEGFKAVTRLMKKE